MHACLASRQPAPVLARGATRLRRCLGPNAFGNALGDSLAAANGQSSGRYASDDPLGSLIALNGGWAGVSASPTFAEDRAMRDLARNPRGLPTSSAAQLISDQGWSPTSGYGYAGSGSGITGWQPGPSAVRAGDYGGSMERVARAQLGAGASQRDVNNYVGQLFELNGITNPRAVGGDMQIALPGANTPAATSGLGLYGKDIALGEQMRANDRAQQMAASAQAATNSSAGFADGRDARDMRLSFGYQSMMSRELSDLRSSPGSELRASTLSPRETAVDWVRSVVGTDRAGNVISGAVNAWLAGGEVLPNLPGAIAAIPSGISRLASGAGSAASQLWNDPAVAVTGAMASGVDGFRTSFNQTVNGNGSAMGSALFALGTLAPSGVRGAGLGLTELDPMLIRTTQTTVKQQGATIPKLVESMQRDGFFVEPDRLIDVVRMSDGGLTSLDNTRILAAQRAGVNIQARVFDHTDLLPNDLDYISRFVGRKGEVPMTYGDAVRNRIGNQSSAFRNLYPNGSPYIGSAY